MIWFETALACGGFACNGATPVVQTAERIAFAIEPDGYVEAHVQVSYEGPPEAFAWVVPVPAEPEVFVSNDVIFGVIDQVTAPSFRTWIEERNCFQPAVARGGGCKGDAGVEETDALDEPTFDTDAPDPTVTVTDEGQAGPYDYVVLASASETAVVTYLQDNGFDVPSELSGQIAPYLVPGGRFLAVRLTSDADTGDIAPLGFRYRGTQASIPLQLTAIAASEDMGVQVSVFGDSFAVPTNYLHIQPDLQHVTFTDNGQNYYDVIARAVDEAGGHAFATDYAGWAGTNVRFWPTEGDEIVQQLRDAPTTESWLTTIRSLSLPANSATRWGFEGFEEAHTATMEDFLGDAPDFDTVALTEQLEERLFPGLRRAQKLFDHAYVTRMVTAISPSEMTVDPIFALNPARTEVARNHSLIRIRDCDQEQAWNELDGTHVAFPLDRSGPYNLVIEQYDANGPAEVLVANPAPLVLPDAYRDRDAGSTSCSSNLTLPGVWLVVFGGLLGISRRRLS